MVFLGELFFIKLRKWKKSGINFKTFNQWSRNALKLEKWKEGGTGEKQNWMIKKWMEARLWIGNYIPSEICIIFRCWRFSTWKFSLNATKFRRARIWIGKFTPYGIYKMTQSWRLALWKLSMKVRKCGRARKNLAK